MDVTSDGLLATAGVALSLLCSYAPGVGDWYNGLASDAKRSVMLGALVIVTAAIYGAGCAGVLPGVDCSQAGAVQIVRAFLSALIANQTTDRISPRVGRKASA